MTDARPYAGLKVVDISQGIAGPYAAMLLAQHGADVVKIEPPEGDWARILGRRYGDHTAFSIAGNLGKRSIAVDLKSPEGLAIVQRLVDRADLFLEGFRPGVAERLGLGHAAVSSRNPRIVYVSVSGFGQKGPLRERPGMDPVLQAFTGMIDSNKGLDGAPHRVPFIPVDMATALYAFQAIAPALYAQRDTGRGSYIDVNLLQGAACIQTVRMMATWLEGGEMQAGLTPSGVYRTADGWMQLSLLRDAQFGMLCDVLELPEAKHDPRFATNALRTENEPELTALIERALIRRPTAEWSERLTRAGLLHERVNTYAEFITHPHTEALGAIAWRRQPGLDRPAPVPTLPGAPLAEDGTPSATAPSCGQHTEAILREIGYTAGEIAALLEARVVRTSA